MSSIVCTGLSFSWPDETVQFADLSFAMGDGRTGLVAPNGAGKSTLLELIAGRRTPTAGELAVDGVLGYLPQTLPFTAERTVAEVLGIADVRGALAALAAGDAREEVFTAIGDDWDVEERALAQLDRLGLGHLGLDRPLGSVSGGEAVFLGLAAELLKRPDVLLLDEPTNNLDAAAREGLYAALDGFSGCLVVAGHDRALLDRMDRIAELHRDEMRFYGGGFSAYRAAVAAERQLAEDHVRHAERDLKREKRQQQQARERAARRAGNAARTLEDAGLPKIVAGARKRRAQESAGRADDVHGKRVDDALARLDAAQREVRGDGRLVLDLPATAVPAGRTVLVAEGVRVRDVFGGNGIDLAIRGPERIALTGPNGAGKSTLLRVLAGDLAPDAGLIRRADGRVAYLSQRLDLLAPDRSVAESLATTAPTLTHTRRRHLLAQFLFTGDRIHLPVAALSGGERLRATLACVLYAEPAPHLLLLDEPTNNLDLVSLEQLEAALDAYRGAFVVVSHDERFLDGIAVGRRLRLDGGELAAT